MIYSNKDVMKVSIIIPVKEINDYVREAIPYLQKLDYPNYEIIIFPDILCEESFKKTKIIETGKIGPSEKRDLAMKYATGDIFAFIDDDAYPRADWLKNAIRHFTDESIAAVGGPAVTPESDSLSQKASGKVYESILAGGNTTYRYIPVGGIKEVDDFPTVNLIVRKVAFEAVGGFDSTFYPGEDTKLCHDITKNLGKKIIYDPEVLVWHHRRKIFIPHLKQVTNYGLHRGYFARVLPKTSFRIAYFIPSVFFLGIIIGPIVSAFLSQLWNAYFGVLFVYFILLILSVSKIKDKRLAFLTIPAIFLTHLSYGLYFIKGFIFTKKLKR